MTLVLLLHLSYLGSGLIVIHLLFNQEEYSWYLKLALGYFVGVFLHVIVLHSAIIVTITSPAVSWLLLLVGLLCLIYEIKFLIRTCPIKMNFIFAPRLTLILRASIFLLLIPVIYLVTLKLLTVPDISFDSTAFWNLKAKYFFYGDHLWTDAFMNLQRIHPHKNYPLYLPIFLFEHYSILGVADDFMTKPGIWIYYFCGMVLFFMLTQEWVGNLTALMIVALVLYTPLHSWHSIQGSIATTYVDFLLSITVMASVGLFLRYLRYGKQIDIFAVMIFLCSAILQKREGSVWFIIFLVFGLMGMWFSHKRTWDREYGWFAIPLIVFVSWLLVRAQLPQVAAEIHSIKLGELAGLREVYPQKLQTWVEIICQIIRLWGAQGIFVTLGFSVGFLRNLRKGPCLVPGLMVLGYLGVIFLVIMLLGVQAGGIEHFVKWSHSLCHRLLIHIYLAGIFLATVMNSPEFTANLQTNPSANRSSSKKA